MTHDNDHRLYGWLERPIAQFFGNLFAALYCLKNPLRYTVGVEFRHVEDRNKRNQYGEPLWREEVSWIGVMRADPVGRLHMHKTFFGKSRFSC